MQKISDISEPVMLTGNVMQSAARSAILADIVNADGKRYRHFRAALATNQKRDRLGLLLTRRLFLSGLLSAATDFVISSAHRFSAFSAAKHSAQVTFERVSTPRTPARNSTPQAITNVTGPVIRPVFPASGGAIGEPVFK
jgi:hypothetical protein